MSCAVRNGDEEIGLPPPPATWPDTEYVMSCAHEILPGGIRWHGHRPRAGGETVTALADGEGVSGRGQPG